MIKYLNASSLCARSKLTVLVRKFSKQASSLFVFFFSFVAGHKLAPSLFVCLCQTCMFVCVCFFSTKNLAQAPIIKNCRKQRALEEKHQHRPPMEKILCSHCNSNGAHLCKRGIVGETVRLPSCRLASVSLSRLYCQTEKLQTDLSDELQYPHASHRLPPTSRRFPAVLRLLARHSLVRYKPRRLR